MTRKLLFICSRNRLRSPTAEQVFADRGGVETASAGLSPDAENPLTPELLAWADIVFVMERAHRTKLSAVFGKWLGDKRVVCLDIPDDYAFMEPRLVVLLEARVSRHLPSH
ncbi:low molecular weight protein tyrosine phosphatase family protein [Rhodanobacter sp. L36]|uniref:low molecular weight protein tyrosine phosphatase family protein n=1 Tax=Rhodanobacter sp. L36 TaxID=1747221 RepID=UPI00131A70D0|nr:low molecular weight protein tyrosine phosphatase family protein [Rhodanobacter sp. L36]